MKLSINYIILTYAEVAQLVEQRTENPRVASPILALGTKSRNIDRRAIFLL